MRALGVLGALGVLAVTTAARGEDISVAEAQKAQLEALRSQVASQIQLSAFDLLDELVYGWSESPPFAVDTAVVLADVSVPVGFGTGLQALIENHFISLVVKNKKSHVALSHCPQCTALVVHSDPKGTIVSRGVDDPAALEKVGIAAGSRHALFLDFEAEGSFLVLRARITSLEPTLPIVYARTLSSSTSAAALLRDGAHLKSAEEARKEYLDALAGRGPFLFPVRLGLRTYATPSETFDENGNFVPAGIAPLPSVWLQAGANLALTQARAWTAEIVAGATWFPAVHTGWLVQMRAARLLTGTEASLTAPDLYGFIGGAVIGIHGPGALQFKEKTPTIADILIASSGVGDPDAIFGTVQAGLELRVGNRIAIAGFAESAPTLPASAVGSYLDLLLLKVNTLGVEVALCF